MKHFSSILLFCFLMISTTPSGFSRSTASDMPYFALKVDISGYNFSIYLNGVPVVTAGAIKQGIPLEAELPLNPYILPGNNNLTLHLSPVISAHTISTSPKAKITLLQYKHFKSDSVTKIADLKYTDALMNSKGIKLNKSFVLTSPLPKWAWMTSDTIVKTKATHQALIAQYQKIWDAVDQKKVETILPLFEERNQELSIAFHKSADYYRGKMKRLAELSVDTEAELFPLEPEDSILEVFGNGRLAKLTRWDGLPMIGFNFKDDSGSENADIIFRKEGNQWIITR